MRIRASTIVLLALVAVGVGLVVTGAVVANRSPEKVGLKIEGAYFNRSHGEPAYAGDFRARKGPSGAAWLVAGFLALAAAGAVAVATSPRGRD